MSSDLDSSRQQSTESEVSRYKDQINMMEQRNMTLNAKTERLERELRIMGDRLKTLETRNRDLEVANREEWVRRLEYHPFTPPLLSSSLSLSPPSTPSLSSSSSSSSSLQSFSLCLLAMFVWLYGYSFMFGEKTSRNMRVIGLTTFIPNRFTNGCGAFAARPNQRYISKTPNILS